MVERDERGVWHQATYATFARLSWRVAGALLALGASADRPVIVLGPNGIDHAVVALGAMRAGIPVAAVAPCAAGAGGLGRLHAIAQLVRPAVVFARDGAACAAAVRSTMPDAAFACGEPPRDGSGCITYARLTSHAALAAGDAPELGPDTIARIVPATRAGGETRGVVTTHGMLCAMLEGLTQRWNLLEMQPPVVVDGVPWHRAFGWNVVLGLVLRARGTLYVNAGDEVQPTLAFDVPSGWARRVERLRGDDALRRRWVASVERACWFGAPLSAATRDALVALGVPLSGLWGAAETASVATLADGTPGHEAIGVPLPGVELRLVRDGERFEARVRGPNVTPGYWWRPDATALAFDDEGFFRTGDAVRPIDGRAPRRGLAIVGRLDDRFKLASGAWVDRAAVRAEFLAECSDASDAIVTGDGRDEVGLLAVPASAGERLERGLLRAQVATAARRVAAASCAELRRTLIVDRAPRGREAAALIARLHASEPDAEVIVL